MIRVVPDRGDVGVRIDRVLLRHLRHIPGITRNRVQRLIAAGAVLVNGRQVARASARIAPGDDIAVHLPERRTHQPPSPENLPVDVRYEDDRLLIVNKPAGQVSHPAFRHSSGTLLNALLAYARGAWTPALVSRLDKGTSGLVLVAKTSDMHRAMQRLWQETGIEKEYLTIVSGKPPRRGTIDLALDRDPWDARRVTARDRGGMPSITKFERIRFVTIAPGRYLSLLRCRLITGRMHQIRVHLAARGWPIVGDATYGVRYEGMDRQALHAWRLAFDDPARGERVEVTAPPPGDMAAVLARFEVREVSEHGSQR